jgi:hypothetical protein
MTDSHLIHQPYGRNATVLFVVFELHMAVLETID